MNVRRLRVWRIDAALLGLWAALVVCERWLLDADTLSHAVAITAEWGVFLLYAARAVRGEHVKND